MYQEYKEDEYEEEDEWLNMRGEALEYIKNKEEAILKKWLNDIGYKEPIGYYRNVLTHTMKIYASKIGWLVGVEGVNVSKLKKMLSEEFYGKWNVEFIEVRGGFINV